MIPSRFPHLVFLLISLFILLVSSHAFAQQRIFEMVYHIPTVDEELMKKNPGVSRDSLIVSRSRAISEELGKRLERRLKAASIKDFRVQRNNFNVKITIGGRDAQEPRILELLKGAGKVELRPVLVKGGPNWSKLAPTLPEDITIMGDENRQYLWSLNFDTLQSTLDLAAMLSAETVSRNGIPANMKLIAAPLHLDNQSTTNIGKNGAQKASGGWRSYLLGNVVSSNQSIEKATWQMNSVGGYSVSVTLRNPVSLPEGNHTSVAILVDDEVLKMIPAAQIKHQFRIEAPKGLSKGEQRVWARAVAGKLSADIDIPYAISKVTVDGEVN